MLSTVNQRSTAELPCSRQLRGRNCWTLNREIQISNPLCSRFKAWEFLFSPWCLHSLSSMNEYLGEYTVMEMVTRGNIWVYSLHAVIGTWLNASRRSRVGVGINMSAKEVKFRELWWWKCVWIVFSRNCCVARMLPREVNLVSEWTGLSGVKCKCF